MPVIMYGPTASCSVKCFDGSKVVPSANFSATRSQSLSISITGSACHPASTDEVAEFISETKGTIYDAALDQQSLLARASPAVPREMFNSPAWMSAELPASNGHGNARSLSQFYAILANGGAMNGRVLLSPETLRAATTVQHEIHEIVMDRTYRQALGFLKSSPPIVVMGPEPEAFGHQGAGGALGFGDPVNKVGFAYLQNKMHARRENGPRAKRLIDAAYAAL